MMNKTILRFFIFLYFFNNQIIGQTDKLKITNLLTQSQKTYNITPVFKLSTKYTLFANYTSEEEIESYRGKLVKNKTEFYLKVQNTEFINLKKINLKIDHESKLMEISSSEKTTLLPGSDIKEIINNFNSFQLDSNENFWICILSTPEISFIPYHKIIIYIDKKNLTIHKQEMYFLNKQPHKNKQGKIRYEFPRLEIEFSLLENNISSFEDKFIVENYIQYRGNKTIPSKQFHQYKIVE